MTTRHVYVDETKRRDYVVVAVVIEGDHLVPVRALVQGLLKRGQHRLHMKDEADGRKETIADAFVTAGLHATIYDAERRYRTQLQARAACLRQMVDDLAASAAETLIVIDQDETLVHSDRHVLYLAVRDVGCAATLRYEHRRAVTESLLGIPDAYAWCWAKGGRWRQLIWPTVTVRYV